MVTWCFMPNQPVQLYQGNERAEQEKMWNTCSKKWKSYNAENWKTYSESEQCEQKRTGTHAVRMKGVSDKELKHIRLEWKKWTREKIETHAVEVKGLHWEFRTNWNTCSESEKVNGKELKQHIQHEWKRQTGWKLKRMQSKQKGWAVRK